MKVGDGNIFFARCSYCVMHDAYCVKAGFVRLFRPLARLGFCWYYCAARLLLILSRGTASVPDAFVIPASEPVSSFSGCRIKSGMTIELPKQKRGGASRPKDNVTIPPFGSAACASSSIILLHYHLIRPLARLGFCKCYRITKTEARRRKQKKQKRGGTNQKNRSAAAQAARKIILLFHPLIRPLAPPQA